MVRERKKTAECGELPARDTRGSERSTTVDWLRAIGIFLVVYGHSGGVPRKLNWVIFAFHVPLFFFLSGYVTRPQRLDVPFRRYLAQVSRTLLPAYVFFAVVGFLAWFLVLRRYGTGDLVPVPPARHLAAIVYGSGSRGDLLFPVVLWFFPCLYVARLLLWPIVRLSRSGQWLAIVVLAAVAVFIGDWVLPWEIESACSAVVFVWGGYRMARRPAWIARLRDSSALAPVALLAAGVVLALVNARVDLRLSHFGNPVLYYAAAFLCTAGLFGIFDRVPGPAVVRKVSASTLVIFPLHPLVFSALAAFYVFILRIPRTVAHEPAVAVGASGLAVASLAWVAPWVLSLLGRV